VSNGFYGFKRKEKKKKLNLRIVENLMSSDFKSGDFEEILDEVEAIVYSHLCQLSKIYQNDSTTINNLLKGASYNA